MKKIVICNIMMQSEVNKYIYKLDGVKFKDVEVAFPINNVLSNELKKGDKVTVALIKKKDIKDNATKNVQLFKDELDAINKSIGADIEYKVIECENNESRNIQEKILRDMIEVFENGAEVLCDITYGPKSLPVILFSALRFGQKHFDINLTYLVYGHVDWVDNKPVNPKMVDMTSLYYLDSLTSTIETNNSQKAKEVLDVLLAD